MIEITRDNITVVDNPKTIEHPERPILGTEDVFPAYTEKFMFLMAKIMIPVQGYAALEPFYIGMVRTYYLQFGKSNKESSIESGIKFLNRKLKEIYKPDYILTRNKDKGEESEKFLVCHERIDEICFAPVEAEKIEEYKTKDLPPPKVVYHGILNVGPLGITKEVKLPLSPEPYDPNINKQ